MVSYLPKGIQTKFRQRLQTAYSKGNYEEAKRALNAIRVELKLINESAVKSLDEGFEETLTIQRLGLYKQLGRSFTTTNMVESIMSMIGRKTGRINYPQDPVDWRNSSQKQRWVATALLWAEQRLNKVNGYRHLLKLRESIQREIGITEGKEVVAA